MLEELAARYRDLGAVVQRTEFELAVEAAFSGDAVASKQFWTKELQSISISRRAPVIYSDLMLVVRLFSGFVSRPHWSASIRKEIRTPRVDDFICSQVL
jgi:hypothetical protein